MRISQNYPASLLIFYLLSCTCFLLAVAVTGGSSSSAGGAGAEPEPEPAAKKATNASREKITDEPSILEFLNTADVKGTELCFEARRTQWNYHTNLNNTEAKSQATKANMAYWKYWKDISDQSTGYDVSGLKNASSKRLFHVMEIYGRFVTNDTQMKKFNEAKQSNEGIFSRAKVCSYQDRTNCNLTLEPDLTNKLANGRDPDEAKYYWLEFRDATGKKMRENYTEMANIVYNAVASGGYYKTVMGAETRLYETPTLKTDAALLWSQLEPFYKLLHGYVRFKLHQYYKGKHLTLQGPIPAHLLGNMWAQSWTNILDHVIPYPHKTSIDVTPKLIELDYTSTKMAEIAEEFFMSLGFGKLPDSFWNGSMLLKPPDREVVCHASAWDMCDGVNYRIKQCMKVTFEDFLTLHHEMGHIYYQMLYKHEPLLFRDGANPGFHEAIGDLIALSVQTPSHLKTIQLLDEVDENDPEADINFLLSKALDSIAFLPFGYLVDEWRWNVFQQIIKAEDMNCAWWNLRVKIQGIAPPVTRTEKDFDPGAKFHIASNTGYIRYFVSSVVQFQFHQALCKIAGQYDPDSTTGSKPLHKCDIHGSKAAGDRLREMLTLGYSKPWQDSMEIMTGSRTMNANAILEYFHPLIKWLEEETKRLNISVGWVEEGPYCVKQATGGGTASQIVSISTWLILSMSFLTYFNRF